jgi:hypothetical protein
MSSNKSAINADGTTINLSHLEREIQQDIGIYHKHAAEDGMKKRAVHTSKDYDEFRNFVSVSQLKPTSGREVSSLFSGVSGVVAKGGGGGNSVCRNRRGDVVLGGFDDSVQRRKNETDPTVKVATRADDAKLNDGLNSMTFDARQHSSNSATATKQTKLSSREVYDFLREWKQQCKDPTQTLSFLTKTVASTSSEDLPTIQLVLSPGETCKQYFRSEIDSQVVGDIVGALRLLLTQLNDAKSQHGDVGCTDVSCIEDIKSTGSTVTSFIEAWLGSLTGCGRFDLSIAFLTKEEQRQLIEVCTFVRDSGEENTSGREYLMRYEKLRS